MDKSLAGNDLLRYAIEQYSDMIVRIAYQNLKNRADAEDMAQEVFIKFFKQPIFNDEHHIKQWLIRVTINQCKNHKKSFWQRKTEPISEALQTFDSEQQHMLDELWKLPQNYRNVIYLHHYEGYTISEIAKILNRKENTVGSWLGRAKKKLKNLLTEGGYTHE